MDALSDPRGTVTVDPCWAAALAARGLGSFSALMDFRGDGPPREKRDRRIVRVVLPGPPPAVLYLKQHRRSPLRDVLSDLLRGRRPRSSAAREWESILALRKAGVATMAPVAFGERRFLSCLGGSFLLTEAVEGVRLEDLARRFGGNFREKRAILLSLAGLARRMHGAGLNHRDFYLCHAFLLPPAKGGGLVLIDLQRVGRRARGRNRWVVKDLAALNYSAPSPAVTRADRARFLVSYLGLASLDGEARRLLRRIAAKTERIGRHDRKRRAREGAPGDPRKTG